MDDFALIRLTAAFTALGDGRSTGYVKIGDGLITTPVSIGPNAKRLPYGEVRQLAQARIAGKTDEEIRALVRQLHEARKATTA